MSRIDLENIKEKLQVESRRSLRMPLVVGKVRRFLWPFVRSYHFLTLEWVRDQIEAVGATRNELGDRLATLGDRQRALRAEVLAVSRQNAELKSAIDDLRFAIKNQNEGTESYSQIGEDRIVSYIFERLGIPLKDICYIDIGSAFPDGHNNTFYFYKTGLAAVWSRPTQHISPVTPKKDPETLPLMQRLYLKI